MNNMYVIRQLAARMNEICNIDKHYIYAIKSKNIADLILGLESAENEEFIRCFSQYNLDITITNHNGLIKFFKKGVLNFETDNLNLRITLPEFFLIKRFEKRLKELLIN